MNNVVTDTFAGSAIRGTGPAAPESGAAGRTPVYTGLVMVIAIAIAVRSAVRRAYRSRAGCDRGSRRRAARPPTLGLLTLFVLVAGIGLMPPIWALVILTVPPLLAGTYAGISSVDRNVVDAARAMGMTSGRSCSGGIPERAAGHVRRVPDRVLQVIATVSVVAYINLGGLGRYLFDGLVLSDFPQMLGGSLLIAALAISIDLILALIQRLFLSRGASSKPNRSQQAAVDLTDPVIAETVVQGGTS